MPISLFKTDAAFSLLDLVTACTEIWYIEKIRIMQQAHCDIHY